jgi:hypothetical protein
MPMAEDHRRGDADSTSGESFGGGYPLAIAGQKRIHHAAAQEAEDRRTEEESDDENHRQDNPALRSESSHRY